MRQARAIWQGHTIFVDRLLPAFIITGRSFFYGWIRVPVLIPLDGCDVSILDLHNVFRDFCLDFLGVVGWLDVAEPCYTRISASFSSSNRHPIITRRRGITHYIQISPCGLGQIVWTVGLIWIHLGELLDRRIFGCQEADLLREILSFVW